MGTLERELRDLGRESAPAGLLPAVLAATVGREPRIADRGGEDRYFELDAEVVRVFVAYGSSGITMVQRGGTAEDFELAAGAFVGRRVRRGPVPADLRAKIKRALAGGPVELEFDLSRLTPFERAVLLKALEIPRGEFRTYGWIAQEIGNPRAVRAVGTALARNPIPLFIPCHRVVRSDGTIGQYGMGGPEMKRRLLLWEGVPEERLGRIARAS